MSRRFPRPDPENASSADVEEAIKALTEWDWETGYSFAHIVIDDHNLTDGHILFCLRPERIAESMESRLKDAFYGNVVELDKIEPWDMWIYRKQIDHMTEVIDLLAWLLEVPEGVRDEAYMEDEDERADS